MKKLIAVSALIVALTWITQAPAMAGWGFVVTPVPFPVPAAPPPYYPPITVYPTPVWYGPGFYPAGYYWGPTGYHYYAHPYWNHTTGYLFAARQTTLWGPNAITLSDAGATVAGTWRMSWTTRKGKNKQGTLQIEQNGSTLGGTFRGERGSFPVTGALQGDHVSFTVKAFGRQLSFSGTVKGNSMHGMTQQQTTWSAARS